jgi:branched-chain amino acid transport system substrate-binding protein
MRKWRWFAAAGILALVATACSSSGKSSTPTTSSSAGSGSPATTAGSTATTGGSATTSPATGTPYKIGAISSDSGPAGTYTDISVTVHNWVSYTNSHGGINGHPVNLTYYNDQSNPALALSDAETLINDHVLAIMDASFVNNAFEKQVDAAKIPVISLDGSGQSFLYVSDPNFFADSTTVLGIIYSQLYSAHYAGSKTYALIYCAENPNCAQAVPVSKAYAPPNQVQITYTGSVSASAPNYTAQCLAAKASGATAMFLAAASSSAIERVAANCASQGYTPVQITASGTVPDAALSMPGFSNVVGTVNTFPYFLTTTPATQLFHQVMDSYLSTAQRPTVVAAVWTGMAEFGTVSANAGSSPTPQAIYTGLYSLNGSTIGGLAPPLTFKQGQPNQINSFYQIKSSNGKYVAINGDQPTCVNPPTLPGL